MNTGFYEKSKNTNESKIKKLYYKIGTYYELVISEIDVEKEYE